MVTPFERGVKLNTGTVGFFRSFAIFIVVVVFFFAQVLRAHIFLLFKGLT